MVLNDESFENYIESVYQNIQGGSHLPLVTRDQQLLTRIVAIFKSNSQGKTPKPDHYFSVTFCDKLNILWRKTCQESIPNGGDR